MNNVYTESPSSFRSPMIQTSFEEKSTKQKDFEQDFTQQQNPYSHILDNNIKDSEMQKQRQHHLEWSNAFGFNRERTGSLSSMGFNDLTENKDEQVPSLWSSLHGGHDYSTKGKSQIRASKSDVTDTSSVGGFSSLDNVIMSPGNRSTHSLKNMGSVDENEQFLGNRSRARTLSAGTSAYRGFKSNFGQEFNNSPINVGTGVRYMKEQQQQASPIQQRCDNLSGGQKQLHGNGHNMHYGHTNTIQENLVHSHSHSREASSMNRTIVGSRQRIMSADAVTKINMSERSPTSIFDSQENLLKQQVMSHSGRSHTSDGVSYNRQRSFTSPSPRQFFESSSSFGDEGGKYFSHTQVSRSTFMDFKISKFSITYIYLNHFLITTSKCRHMITVIQ